MLTIYFDGQCPLCSKEMSALKKRDELNLIELIDLHDEKTMALPAHQDIDQDYAMDMLHGRIDGKLVYGLDVTYYAWSLVGKQHLVGFLRLPIVRPVADRAYLFFAKHRHTISGLFGKQEECDSGTCRKN